MKKFLAFTLLVLLGLSFGVFASVAEDEVIYTCGDYKYVLLADGTAEISDYTGSDSGLSIPTVLDGHQVTSIGEDAFWYCNSLISISIPDSVTSIETNPFIWCSHLTTINVSPNHPTLATIDGVLFEKNSKTLIFYPCALSATSYAIPSGIKIIGDSAFYKCSSLTSISIPDSVTFIGDSAFEQCSSLTNISIPDSVTSIGTNPFKNCYHLTDINVSPNHPTLVTIDGILFEKSSEKLISYPHTLSATSYTIPSGIKIIGDSAFSDCSSLTSISIPDSVTHIGNFAFSWCFSLTSISIPDSVTYIGNSAFSFCSSLTSISVPNSVTYIGNGAFFLCSSLTSISIPNSVTYIGNGAFSDCSSLTSISIPDSVTYIGDSAFSYCPTNLILTVGYGSYAETYCKENNLPYQLQESSSDWLLN